MQRTFSDDGRSRRGPRPSRRPAASPRRVSSVLPAGRFIAGDDIVATGVCDVAERCRPGDVFVARLTSEDDGHEQAPLAVARGAVGVVAERMLPVAGVPVCIVPHAAAALAQLHQAFADHPAGRLRVIAITGTSGKTTTAWLTAAVLAEAGRQVGVLSDLGCLGPRDAIPAAADYASAGGLADRLGWLAAEGCSHAVIEVSSRMLADRVLDGVECDTVVVTNLASAHLDAHGTRAAYHAIKARLVTQLRAGGCLVSGCGPAGEALLRRRLPAGAAVVTTGLAADRDVRATAVEGSLFGRTVLTSSGGQVVPLSLATPVVPFVRDSLLAAAVGGRHGVPLEIAVRGMESAGAVPGRVERIDRGQDAALFVDSPTSRHALAATLGSLRRLTPGRLAVIAEESLVAGLGGGGFGPLVARLCDACVVAPASVLAEKPSDRDVAAYARIDRVLDSLGAGDCGLVLGGIGRGDGPPEHRAGGFPLATLAEAWLRISQTARPGCRHAA